MISNVPASYWAALGTAAILVLLVFRWVRNMDRADERGDLHHSRSKLSHRLNVPRTLVVPNRKRS